MSRVDAHAGTATASPRRAARRVPRPLVPAASGVAGFDRAERRLIARLRTPAAVQRYLNELPYNQEIGGETLRSFRGVVRTGTAHCLEAAVFAAAVLEAHGYPPLLVRLSAADNLDHVLFVYRRAGRWGAVARSRDPGLHGRKPLFRSWRDLALSYVDAYVDRTASIIGYCGFDLRSLGRYDWRLAAANVWKVERAILAVPDIPIRTSPRRIAALRRRFLAFKAQHPDLKPLYFSGQHRWTQLPAHYRHQPRRWP